MPAHARLIPRLIATLAASVLLHALALPGVVMLSVAAASGSRSSSGAENRADARSTAQAERQVSQQPLQQTPRPIDPVAELPKLTTPEKALEKPLKKPDLVREKDKPKPDEEEIVLGKAMGTGDARVAWISHEDFQQLLAEQGSMIQPALQSSQDPTPEARLIVKPSDPDEKPRVLMAQATGSKGSTGSTGSSGSSGSSGNSGSSGSPGSSGGSAEITPRARPTAPPLVIPDAKAPVAPKVPEPVKIPAVEKLAEPKLDAPKPPVVPAVEQPKVVEPTPIPVPEKLTEPKLDAPKPPEAQLPPLPTPLPKTPSQSSIVTPENSPPATTPQPAPTPAPTPPPAPPADVTTSEARRPEPQRPAQTPALSPAQQASAVTTVTTTNTKADTKADTKTDTKKNDATTQTLATAAAAAKSPPTKPDEPRKEKPVKPLQNTQLALLMPVPSSPTELSTQAAHAEPAPSPATPDAQLQAQPQDTPQTKAHQQATESLLRDALAQPETPDAPLHASPNGAAKSGAAKSGAIGAASAASNNAPSKAPSPAQQPRPAINIGTLLPTSAARSDRQSQPVTLNEKPFDVPARNGSVTVADGLEMKTALPSISVVTLSSSLPNNPTAKITFSADGRVTDVTLTKSTGYADWDGPVVASFYKWQASGQRLTELNHAFTITVNLLLTKP